MSYHEFGKTNRLPLRGAPRFFALFLILHLALMQAILVADLAAWLAWPLLLFNALSCASHLRLWAFPSLVLSADQLVLGGDGALLAESHGGDTVRPLQLLRIVSVSPRMLVLRLRWQGSVMPFWLIVCPGGGDLSAFRRFRVRLRLGGVERFRPFRGLGTTGPIGRH